MFAFRPLLRSMRLRTLPLSLAGVVCGGVLGASHTTGKPWTLAFLFLTTIALQVLSNMSNEMGDYRSGVDGEGRVGPAYSLASGGLVERQLWRAINATVVVCCLCGLAMVWCAFGSLFCIRSLLTVGLGALAIWAATHYTLGKHPYGYRGLGDLFVFLFFGIVAVEGSYFVVNGGMNGGLLWPAAGIGLLSVAVLNVNNIRDMESDFGKRTTVPLKLGERRAKRYHLVLLDAAWLCLLVGPTWCAVPNGESITFRMYAFVLTLPLFVWHAVGVCRRTGKALDPMLPLLVMGTFLMSLLYTWGCYGI